MNRRRFLALLGAAPGAFVASRYLGAPRREDLVVRVHITLRMMRRMTPDLEDRLRRSAHTALRRAGAEPTEEVRHYDPLRHWETWAFYGERVA